LPKRRQTARKQRISTKTEARQSGLSVKPGDLRAFRWGWMAFVILATSLPYLVFWFRTPANHRYTWILPPYPEDSFAYMAWSQQAAHGNLLFRLKYTALPHAPFVFHPFFLLSGWMSRLSACDIGIVHWVMKAVGTGLFFVVLYAYTDWLQLNRFQSVVASVLVGISAGFGGLFPVLGLGNQRLTVPADLWMPEMSTYFSLLWNVLFPCSLALLVLIIYWLDRGSTDARKAGQENDAQEKDAFTKCFWLGGFAAAVLALIHPYVIPLVFAFAAIIVLVRARRAGSSLLVRFFLASSPGVLYVVLVSLFQPLASRHSTSGEMESPGLLYYLLGFGLPLLICVAALTVTPGQWIKRNWQLVLWFLLSLGFAYLPFWFQRKLIFGAQIPVCILAAICLDLILTRFPGIRNRNWALATVAVVSLPLLMATPVYLLRYAATTVRNNADDTYYMSNDMLAGLRFLKEKTQPEEIVYANIATSRLIPAFSGNTVLWGHWAQSVDFAERRQWNAHLFQATPIGPDQERSEEFWGTGIHYIFADTKLKKSIEENPEKWRGILHDADLVFTNSSVVIYKHRTGGPSSPG